MKILYSILWIFLIPFALLRLVVLSFRNPKYLDRFWQRLGWIPRLYSNNKAIWIHAVSVGEAVAARTLVLQIQNKIPDIKIIITTGTPTGADTVQRLYGDTVHHLYQPYDLGLIVEQFIRLIQPKCLILMETELWPNLISRCYQHQIPILLVNARMSERSAKRYQRFHKISSTMLQQITQIAAQTDDDKQRLLSLGATSEKITVTGSIKFDLDSSPLTNEKIEHLKASGLTGRPIWIAASTHSGEEAITIDVHQSLIAVIPNALLILVPRHPERCQEIFPILDKQELGYQTWSESDLIAADTRVLLVDTIGELLEFYAVADAAFVGGSLTNNGGHNPLEPAAFAKPVLIGPQDYNFLEIGQKLIQNQGAIRVHNKSDLYQQVLNFLKDPENAQLIGSNACQYVQQNRGSTEKVWNIIQVYLT